MTRQVELMHQALDALVKRIESQKQHVENMGDVRIARRTNGATGPHVHASCTVKLRFDASVNEMDAEKY